MYDAILRNHINELQQTKPSAITTYANIPRVDRFCQFFVCFECMRGHRGRGFESHYRSYSQSGLGAE